MEYKRLRLNGNIIVSYSLLTVLFTYPLVTKLTTHIPGVGGDAYQFYWSVWWVKYSIFDNLASPYFTDLLFYPYGTALHYSTMTLFNGLLAAPIMFLLGPTLAFNIVFLLMFPVAGWGMFLLADYIVDDRRAAFFAGLIFTFSPFRMVRTECHLNILSIQWLPFFVFFLLKALRTDHHKNRNMIAAALAFAANTLSCWYYMVYGLLMGAFLTIAEFAVNPSIPSMMKKSVRYLIILGLAGLFASPAVIPIISAMIQNSDSLYMENSEFYSVDLASYFLPNHLNPVLGQFARSITGEPDGTFHGNRCEGMAALGYSVLILAVVGCWRSKKMRPWWGLALLGMAFSLGPVMYIVNEAFPGIPMPYNLLKHLPVLKGARVPGRFAVVVVFCVSILAAQGLSKLLRAGFNRSNLRRNIVLGCFSLIVLFEYLPIPLRTCQVKVPDLLAHVRDDPECESVMVWPTSSFKAMVYQTFHKKPILDASVARLTRENLKARWIRKEIDKKLVGGKEGDIFNPPPSLTIYPKFHKVKYLIIDWNAISESRAYRNKIDAIRKLVCEIFREEPVWSDQNMEIFQFRAPDLGFTPVLSGDGWSDPVIIDGKSARILKQSKGIIEIVACESVPHMTINLEYRGNQSIKWFWNDSILESTSAGQEEQDTIESFYFKDIPPGVHHLSVESEGTDAPLILWRVDMKR